MRLAAWEISLRFRSNLSRNSSSAFSLSTSWSRHQPLQLAPRPHETHEDDGARPAENLCDDRHITFQVIVQRDYMKSGDARASMSFTKTFWTTSCGSSCLPITPYATRKIFV